MSPRLRKHLETALLLAVTAALDVLLVAVERGEPEPSPRTLLLVALVAVARYSRAQIGADSAPSTEAAKSEPTPIRRPRLVRIVPLSPPE